MDEKINLFTQYSDLRAAKRAELESAGVPEREIREALQYVVPALVRSKQPGLSVAAQTDTGQTDARWDVPDTEGAMPSHEEAEAAVMGRLATYYQAFHSKPGETSKEEGNNGKSRTE